MLLDTKKLKINKMVNMFILSSLFHSKHKTRETTMVPQTEVTKKRMNVILWGRKRKLLDIVNAFGVLTMHVLCLFAPFTFSWGAYLVYVVLVFMTALLGITISYHRNLTHRSFKLPKWLEYFFAYCGAHALQLDPIFWVSTHRYHHQFADTEKDPHSPNEGFWYSHINWIFDTITLAEKRSGRRNNVDDLEKQPFYRFLQKTYFVHPIALAAILYACGGFSYIVWGMGARIVTVYHCTFLVNSAAHLWGKQAWNTGDDSKNNWWVAIFSFGEGWHNNHHAFPYSARHGLEWWQIDVTWWIIMFLEAIGLATDVKLPEESHKKRLALKNN
ncbi:hypothetical protein Leryth_025534 [Lithospermum erythrorhizon]|uniref:Fatty acid desaturase domain-containing protein n=1 Tax=Lithospermum erythrorhizon TaxID=34254 RepID=A0AAV3R1H5_LITER|nr:hypothetical protein Leryth_025534 [Lithospermum erythrorhizon]